ENTLSCIRQGIATGADMVEVDVHLTRDGEVVVCHDETIDRTTDAKGRIEDLDFEELRSARIVDAEGKVMDECIPTLEEVLRLIDGQCGLLLEIKLSRPDQYPGLSRKCVEIVDACGMREKTVFQSFNDIVLEELHALDASLPLEKLIVCRLPFGLCFDGRLTRFSFEKYDYVEAVNAFYRLTSKRFVNDAHKAGKKVRVWTLDGPSRLIPYVDGIITNDPALFMRRRPADSQI
ncbi:MAG: hypothetical protein IJ636_02730, partial [Bacteroidales bacterium]|nr:hypothetical protein [Bacteroidales bacterium]